MSSIDAATLQQKIARNEDVVLIDVRETWERKLFNIGGISIPMNDVMENLSLVPKDKPVVFYCEKGIRSLIVIQRLSEKFDYKNLINLTGGMSSWKKVIKP